MHRETLGIETQSPLQGDGIDERLCPGLRGTAAMPASCCVLWVRWLSGWRPGRVMEAELPDVCCALLLGDRTVQHGWALRTMLAAPARAEPLAAGDAQDALGVHGVGFVISPLSLLSNPWDAAASDTVFPVVRCL